MNDSTCVTVAVASSSTDGPEHLGAAVRSFQALYRLLGMYIFVFLLRRFAVCKITQIALCFV